MTTTLKAGLAGLAAALVCTVASPNASADHNGFYFGFSSRDVRVSVGTYDRCPPPRCEPARRWIPGHYEVRLERVCIPGYWDIVGEPAACGWARSGWGWRRVEVRPACERRVWVPERYETREARVWVPACWDGDGRYARMY